MTNKVQITLKKIGGAIVVCCFMFIFAWFVALTMSYARDGSLLAIITALPLALMCALAVWRVRQRPATMSVAEPALSKAIAPMREAVTEEIRIKMTGYSDASRVERVFASSLVDVASIDEVTADCIYVLSEPDVDLGDPSNCAWVTECIKSALNEADARSLQFELEKRTL